MCVNAASLHIRAATTSTSGTLNDLTTDLIMANNNNIYSKINDVTDCNTLQQDLNHVYDWASTNNMFFNAQKFYYVSFSPNKYYICQIYI